MLSRHTHIKCYNKGSHVTYFLIRSKAVKQPQHKDSFLFHINNAYRVQSTNNSLFVFPFFYLHLLYSVQHAKGKKRQHMWASGRRTNSDDQQRPKARRLVVTSREIKALGRGRCQLIPGQLEPWHKHRFMDMVRQPPEDNRTRHIDVRYCSTRQRCEAYRHQQLHQFALHIISELYYLWLWSLLTRCSPLNYSVPRCTREAILS